MVNKPNQPGLGVPADAAESRHQLEVRIAALRAELHAAEAALHALDSPGMAAVATAPAADAAATVARALEAQRQSEERFRLILENAPIGLSFMALDGTLTQVNDRLCDFLGRDRAALLSLGFRQITHPDDLEASNDGVERLLAGQATHFQVEKRYLRPDGSVVHGLLSVALVRDRHGVPLHFIGQVADITEQKRAERLLQEQAEQLRALSLVDELTGLYNRRGFLSLAQQQCNTARRHGKRVLILFADLDGMKEINDRLGHEAGDAALCAGAEILRACFRDSDVVARMGGDEFAVAAMEVAPPTTLDGYVRRIEEAVALFNDTSGPAWQLAMSVGLVEFDPAEPRPLAELLQRADELMYARKRARKLTRRSA
ncbi:GGDEF domain-containing protein [Vulgatibacter sp.]|uniref:GGDEF domain-containing protein n=1 Tax=Vulgatibacter sp. TaxID=1971226 RepID=UPI0035690DEA